MATATRKASVPETWPTGDDYTRALAHLGAATHAVDVLSIRLTRLVDAGVAPSLRAGAEDPQLRDLASLYVFTQHAMLDIRTLKDDVERMEARCQSVSLDKDYLDEPRDDA
jgi:hypothetical protein